MSIFFRAAARPAVDGAEVRGWTDWAHDGAAPAGTMPEDKARRLSYVYAAVRHIADFCATLPIDAFRREGEARVPVPVPRLFRDKQERGELVPWLTAAFASLVVHGNAVGIKRDLDGYGFPRDIIWQPVPSVSVDPDGTWRIAGAPYSAADVVHIPWITVPGQVLGISPLRAYQSTVESALAGQSYTRGWFAAGGIPPGTFKNRERVITPDQSEEIRDRLVSSIRSGKPLVYGSDWDYNAITIPPEQAQFVESQKLTASQIAAVYGIEPQEIGGEAANGLTYNNEEHRQTKRLANMRPYLTRFEHGFNALIPLEQRVRFNGDAIIRADVKTRHEVYEAKLRMGIASRNEIRALEDESPIPGGDTYDKTSTTPNPTTPPAAADGDEQQPRLHVIQKEQHA